MKKLVLNTVIFVLLVFSFEVLTQKFDSPENTYHKTFRTTIQHSKAQIKEKLIKTAFHNCIIHSVVYNYYLASTAGNYLTKINTHTYTQPAKKILRI